MHCSVITRGLILLMCSVAATAYAVIKDPLIDGFAGCNIQENQVIVTLILSQDSYAILDAISKQETDMEVEEALLTVYDFLYKEKNRITSCKEFGTFAKIKGQRYFHGPCTKNKEVIQGVKYIITATIPPEEKIPPLMIQEHLHMRLLSDYVYNVFLEIVKTLNPAQFHIIDFKYKRRS